MNKTVAVIGVLAILLGVDIIASGKLREVIVLGDEKYVIGSISIIFGLYALVLSFKK